MTFYHCKNCGFLLEKKEEAKEETLKCDKCGATVHFTPKVKMVSEILAKKS
jgi:DNA-directed RNA polymerase subunit M/transcription elongation factor TFIIS